MQKLRSMLRQVLLFYLKKYKKEHMFHLIIKIKIMKIEAIIIKKLSRIKN